MVALEEGVFALEMGVVIPNPWASHGEAGQAFQGEPTAAAGLGRRLVLPLLPQQLLPLLRLSPLAYPQP